MTRKGGAFLYQARERSKQETEITHAALARVEDRGQGPRLNLSLASDGHLISLSDRPVVEQPTCAHDTNMHTERTGGHDGRTTLNHRRGPGVNPPVTMGVATLKTHDGRRASQGSPGVGGGDPPASKKWRPLGGAPLRVRQWWRWWSR